MKTTTQIFAAGLLLLLSGCKKELTPEQEQSTSEITSAPVLPAHSYDYHASSNDSLAELGRVLFYDKNLSLNNSVSCGSCHQQAKAFCDNERFSTGLEDMKTPRNSPSIFAKNGSMFWDGRAANMRELAFMPVQNHVEMKFSNLQELTKKIARIDYYRPLIKKVFNKEYADEAQVQGALNEFLVNFNFSNHKFSRSERGIEKLTASEANGRDLFFGKAKCSTCHDLGNPGNNNSGGYGAVTPQSIFNIGLDYKYTDKGVGDLSGQAADEGKFLIPVLLNVELTAPYMHDGRFRTLAEVVEHYNSGVKDHANLSPRLRDFSSLGNNLNEQQILDKVDKNGNRMIDPAEAMDFPPIRLNLSENEKRNLVDFLKTLTDHNILNDAKFSNPFSMK